ncbi:peptide/nickel transport system permease protein [Methanomicrobium sp. W14]|uniref:ABC transporter permease n=1 Tax=Methanomicrobium sp. W14 TaxID=2817839 RepID=UPI001AEB0F8A|nr:ABC transporter permease [Methanomicrobium sp. W14]MBP2132684.1 peptide/nickel transport system permease protein [Methanomicrobium sp. W14]
MSEYPGKKRKKDLTCYFNLDEVKKSDWYFRLKKRRGLQIVFVLIGVLILLSAIAPYLAPQDPNAADLYSKNLGPSPGHISGTDYLGRDLFSRVVFGLQTSMKIALTTVALSFVIGVAVGSYSGYKGGLADNIIARIIDVFLAFPTVILALALIALIGPGILNMVVMLSVVQWASLARLMRGQVLHEKNQEYVLSARAFGFSDYWILTRHIIPNCVMPVVVLATMDIGHTVLMISTLSFLGMGIPSTIPEWGSMISSGISYMRIAPLNVIVPGIAITIVTLLFNTAGEGIRDITDPKSDGEGSL